jgi:flagellar protein FliO/FliZ
MTKLTPLSRAVAQAAAVLGACLLAFACPASAYTPATKAGGENTPLNLKAPTTTAHTSSGGASIVRTIVGLAIVIAVIWGLSWILRQVKAGREGGLDSNQSSVGLASVAALTLTTGRSVHLIRAGSDYVLLGSAEHGLVPIHRYTEQEAREAGLPLLDDIDASQPRRRSLLARSSAAGRPPAVRRDAPNPRQPGGWGPSRPDPMRMTQPSSGLVERMRELTVRR